MKGADQERTYKEIVFKGTKLYIAEWAIWPPAQFIVSLYVYLSQFLFVSDTKISVTKTKDCLYLF